MMRLRYSLAMRVWVQWCAGLMLLPVCAWGQASPAETLFVKAMGEQQRRELPAAIRDYQRVLQLNPKLTDARVNLGAALAQNGQYDEAIRQYRVALTALPSNAEVRRNLGLAYYKKGDFAGAMREFQTVQKVQPNDVALAILLGDCEVKSGKPAEALAMLQPLEAANADNADLEYMLGVAMIASGDRRPGVDKLQKVAEATQGADVYLLAGLTLMDLNEFERAHRDLNEAMRINPKLPHIQTLAGKADDGFGDTKDAEADFREALKIDPADADANLYLGAILLRRRSTDEAKGYLEKALQLNPTSVLALYQVAKCKSALGDYAAAAEGLEKVVKTNPDWLDPHVELASVYYKLKRPEDGAKQREIVAKINEEQQKRGPK